MKNLGKILILLFCIHVTLFANVKATLDTRVVYSGEMVTYRLSMQGNDILKPSLTQICGNDVVATSSQTSIENINGNYSKTYTLSYQFMPEKSCTIVPTEVSIDGKIEKSNSVKLIVKEPTQDKKAPFTLKLETPKKSFYVGEPFDLTLTLKQSLSAQAVDSKFVAPEFKGFWVKSEGKPTRVDDGENVITTVVYTLAPQREGNFTIEPAQLRIASRVSSINGWGSFAPQVKWRSYYSNKPKLIIKAIPHSASLIGDFSIHTKLEKTEINENEALNLSVVVDGIGNLEDIKSFKPYIQNVNVFDEKIVIKKNRLTQKLAFVSDSNFTIPSFELAFFNTKTQTVQKIKTEPIKIVVNTHTPKKELSIQREEKPSAASASKEVVVQSEIKKSWLVIAFSIGLVLGIGLMLLKPFIIKKREKSFDFKDEKILLMKLLPYKEDKEVQNILNILENNLYSNTKEKVDKKLLKEIIKRYEIS